MNAANEAGIRDGIRKAAAVSAAPAPAQKPAESVVKKGLKWLGAGALLHGATNLAVKGFRGSRAGHKFEQAAMAAGIRRGMAGKDLGPITKDVARFGVGPESLITHSAGIRLGKKLLDTPEHLRDKVLAQTIEGMKGTKHLKDAPIIGHASGAAKRLREGKETWLDRLPSVGKDHQRTSGSKATSGALGAAALAVNPHTGLHFGLNFIRHQTVKSKMGKDFLKKQLRAGYDGEKMNKATELATDIGVSPGALDARRIGAAARKELLDKGLTEQQVTDSRPKIEEMIRDFYPNEMG